MPMTRDPAPYSTSQDIHIESLRGRADWIREVPEDFLTYETCLAAVREDGTALEWVPLPLRDEPLCLIALSNGAALSGVPYPWSDAIIDAAISVDGNALRFIKTPSPEICRKAIARTPLALAFVRSNSMTYGLCLEAASADAKAFEHVPDCFLHQVEKAIRSGERACETDFIPEECEVDGDEIELEEMITACITHEEEMAARAEAMALLEDERLAAEELRRSTGLPGLLRRLGIIRL